MAITSLDQYIAAAKQRVTYLKSVAMTATGFAPHTMIAQAGNPGAGVLAGTSVAAGVVPDDTTAGFPALFSPGGVSYLSKVEFGNTVASRMGIYDLLWKGGAYPFNASQTLSGQPAISGRCPDYAGGSTFGNGIEIWLECVTAFTGNITVAVTYTNSAGVTGRTTGTFAPAVAPILGRMIQMPLQSGDSGVQKIESVTATIATVGTFNVLLMRPLWTSGRVKLPGDGDIHDMLKTGMPVVYNTSALYLVVQPDSGSSGIPELNLEIASA
jgi:hypothetical protein